MYDRTDLPIAITQMSFDSYTIPISSKGELPFKLFGRKLRLDYMNEKKIPFLILLRGKRRPCRPAGRAGAHGVHGRRAGGVSQGACRHSDFVVSSGERLCASQAVTQWANGDPSGSTWTWTKLLTERFPCVTVEPGGGDRCQ